jgi:hypothetical protein
MIRVAVAVQHAPWAEERRVMLVDLLQWMSRQYVPEGIEVVPVGVEFDRGSRRDPEGVWPSNKRAWLRTLYAHDVTHCLVLQDDMTPCQDFWTGVKASIDAWPEGTPPIVYLCNRQAVDLVIAKGPGWLGLPDGTWGGATLMTPDQVKEFLDWEKLFVAESCPSADARVDLWLRMNGKMAYATVPSLIDHMGQRSLIGHSKDRCARVLAPSAAAARFPRDNTLNSGKHLSHHMFKHLKKVPAQR